MSMSVHAGHAVSAVSLTGTATAVALFGLGIAWIVVAAIVILFAELALCKLLPRRRGYID
jgi:hypothetical protein